MQVGPAGEKMVRFANIINMSNRANGRTGMGTVMAAKNLKAIAIKGTLTPEFHDPDALKALASWALRTSKSQMSTAWERTARLKLLPPSMKTVVCPPATGPAVFSMTMNQSAETMSKTVLKKRDTCYACVVRCKRVVEITEGDYEVDPLYGGPDSSALSARTAAWTTWQPSA